MANQKQQIIMRAIEHGSGHVLVHVDARYRDVLVPDEHAGDRRLILSVGRSASQDTAADNEAMSCTLTFATRMFRCVLPWRRIFAVRSDAVAGEIVIWEDELPDGVRTSEISGIVVAADDDPGSGTTATDRPRHLFLVP